MKKIRIGIFLLFSTMFLSACSSEDTASSFISFDDNLLLIYNVDGPTPFTIRTFNSYAEGSRLQRMSTSNVGFTATEVLELRGRELLLVIGHGFAHHNNITGNEQEVHAVILSEPIQIGHSWLESPFMPEGESHVREITGTGITVTTPAGTFETIEVTVTYPLEERYVEPRRRREYHAPGIGLVKQITYTGRATNMEGWDEPDFEEHTITKRLVEIRREGYAQTIDVFYAVDDVFAQMEITYTTNNDLTRIYAPVARRVLELSLDHPAAGDGIDINFAIFNPETGGLNLDFSAAFTEAMGRVRDYEQERRILNAIATTFGVLYSAHHVRITVDGLPYSGPNIALGLTEFIPTGQGIWQ